MAQLSEHEAQALRKRRIRWFLQRASERAISSVEIIVALGGLLVAILLSIPWLSGPFAKIGLTSSGNFSRDVLIIVVVSIFFEVRRLAGDKPSTSPRHFPDPMDVYPVLLERARSITRKDEQTLDVLGMTLYTAWPSIRFWLNRSDLVGWTVRLTALGTNDKALSKHVPSSWFRDARANLESIAEYAQSPAAQQKNICLKPYVYDFMPSLHGYRLGNGDLFYSILYWRPDGLLSIDNFSYEFVPCEDSSPSAKAIRQVFQSWFDRATAVPWPGNTPRK